MAYHWGIAFLSVDNTSAMVGKRNSIASRLIQKDFEIFVSGCPRCPAYISANLANDAIFNIGLFVSV